MAFKRHYFLNAPTVTDSQLDTGQYLIKNCIALH